MQLLIKNYLKIKKKKKEKINSINETYDGINKRGIKIRHK